MKRYNTDFKQQVLAECREVGNTCLVARRHNLSVDTIYGWNYKSKKLGTPKALPREAMSRMSELEQRLAKIGTENDQLKRIVAEKELELAILRDLRDKVNPR